MKTYSKDDKTERKPVVKGGFKKCIVYRYEYKFGKIDIKSKYKVYSYKYNDLGYED